MYALQSSEFVRRIRKVQRKHRDGSFGFVRLEERDGLLVPKEARLGSIRRNTLSWTQLFVLIAAAFIVFKAFLMLQMGPETYQQYVSTMSQASVFEQVGSWFLIPDPVSEGLYKLFMR